MRFQTPLVPATLIRRYKRFLADIRLEDGREVTAHCPNPGSMLGMSEAGLKVWVEPNDDPKKKLKYGLRLIEQNGAMIVVDTGLANKVVGEALRAGVIPDLIGDVRSEVKYGENSRVDFLIEALSEERSERLEHPEGIEDAEHAELTERTWVEVKSVTMSREAGLAEFPDSKTVRGAKHLNELATRVEAGDRAVMLYLINRTDCSKMALAADIDPHYAQSAQQAHAAGVKMMAFGVQASTTEITLVPLPIQAHIHV